MKVHKSAKNNQDSSLKFDEDQVVSTRRFIANDRNTQTNNTHVQVCRIEFIEV